MTCRQWLAENGYQDVADRIELAMSPMKSKGSKQRRNWWDVLSGDSNGNPCVREGIEFPVLRVAQIRQGKAVTPGAVCRNDGETPPGVRATGRWHRGRLPRNAEFTAAAGLTTVLRRTG